jgi:small subunit ribosomal protein S27Ae
VDENGKITRLRKECTSAGCGGGVFMASHVNRYYCGKCYQTLVVADPKDKEKAGGSKKK